jgi:hypothetical protein
MALVLPGTPPSTIPLRVTARVRAREREDSDGGTSIVAGLQAGQHMEGAHRPPPEAT